MADAYDILFGQLDAEEIKKVNRSRNYAQALNLGVRDVYDGFDEVEQEFAARRDTWKAKGHDPFTSFNPDAPKGVDPMTGATARDYAELLYPVVDGVLRTGAAAGANTLGAAYQAAGHMLSTFVDMGEYLSKDLGVPRSELFDKMAKATVARGDQFRKYAQEEGIGPVTNWLTEVLGQAPAGIADFMLNVPAYGIRGAMKAEKAGDNEFVGFLKGALERGLMGQVLHAASTLSRPLRMGVTGLVFEEQARHEGITDPDELLKAFATGGLFGVVGGPGKYGTADIRKELGNLEMEARERIRILGEMAPGRILPGERGSNKGEYLGGIESKAKKLLGTTDKLDRAGYITPDGSLLDFSTPSPLRKASYESNRGFTESRFREHDDLPNELGVTPNQFLDSGMVRFAYEPDMTGINVSFNEGQPVSESQFSTIRRAFRTTGEEEIFVDVFPRDDSPPFTESFTSFGDFRKWVDPYLNKPKEPELTMTRALRVGKDIYPIEEGSDHGKTYSNIPTSKLVKAGTDVASGWTDQTGKFYLRSEVPWERTTNMRDLTAGEKEKMGGGRAGDEISTDLLKGVDGGKVAKELQAWRDKHYNGEKEPYWNEPGGLKPESEQLADVALGKKPMFLGPVNDTKMVELATALGLKKVDVTDGVIYFRPEAEKALSKDISRMKELYSKGWEDMPVADRVESSRILGYSEEEIAKYHGTEAAGGAPRYGGGGTAVEKATLAEFESSPPPGYRIKTLPGEDIARAESDGTISLDPNKFFGHGEKDRVDIIAHEKAHFLEEKIPPDVKARLFDDPVVMGYRGRNINEKLANMIQDGKLPQELKGYVEGSGGAGEGGKPTESWGGAPPAGGGPPPDKPKQYTKVLFTKKGSDRQIDPKGKELLNDIVDIEVGVEAETGKPAVTKRYLWEMTRGEAENILKRGGLDPALHELAVDKAMQQGKKVPLEALRGYFSEGDLLAAEGITGIFAMKEHEMKVWLDMKTDASLIYEHTKGLLTKQQHIDIKHEARRATGQVPASELITMREDQLLRNQLLWEVKAAREAMRKGLKEGQAVGAGRLHKAIELARARADARAEINYMIKNIKTVDPKYMTATTADEVTRLLQDLDLSKLSDKKRISLENTLDYLSRSPDTELPDYVLDDLARLHKTPIRDLSYDEIRSIHDAVMSLAAQSERVQTLVVKMREQKVQDAIKQAVTEMKDPDLVDQQIISTRPSMMDKFKGLGHWIKQNLGIRQDSFDLIIESISGINSTSYDVLYRRVKQGILTQKMSQQKAESAFRDHLRTNKFYETVKDPDKWMSERVTTGRFELSRGERMSLYLHSLNEDNYSAMINGGIGFKNPPPSRGLTPNSVVRITEQEIADISRSLTREEKVMVEAAQKMFREQGVDLANEFYRLNRYRMPPQDNYYPKEVMPLRRGGLDLETEDGLEAFRQFTARVGIDKSMLIERVGSQRPIYLNDLMTDVNRSVRRATAYIGLEDAMRNASRMLYDTTYKREIIDRYGRDTWVEMEKGLKDIAGSYKAWTSFEKGITKLKTTTVSSALSINPWVWLNQPFSLLTYWSYIEPRYLAKGLTDSITSPKDTLNGLRMYSSELIDRLKTGYDRDVAAVYAAERDKSFYGGKQTLQEKGITPTKYFDLTAVVPGMRAAVYKALDEFQTGELSKPVRDALNVTPEEAVNWTPEQKIAKAHEFADWVTQRTQAQSTPEHRSPLSRGTPLEQMFTAFTSQTNVMLGLVRRTYRDYDRTKDPEALRSMLKAFTSVFVLNAAAMIGIDRLRDLVYGRDSKSIVAGFIDNTASLLYFVRDIEKTMSSFLEEGHRGKETSVPAARFAETMKDFATHLHDSFSDNKKTAQDAQLGVVDAMAQMVSITTGLPYQTPKRLLQAASGNNPPRKRKKGDTRDFIDELLED